LHLLYTEYLGCASGSAPANSAISATDYGFIASTGGSNPNQSVPYFLSVDTIGNDLKNPCFRTVLNTLQQNGLKNELTSILLGTFGVDDQINLTFLEAPTTSNSSDAQTKPDIKVGYIDITTTLSEQKLANASKEFIAETMFHEIIHAYLDANSNVHNELQQHCQMIETYVACELNALQEIFPKLSSHDGLSLILDGFEQVQEYDQDTFNTLLSYYKLSLNDISQTNSKYESGTAGTPCGLPVN
jgi:hypothetical protein